MYYRLVYPVVLSYIFKRVHKSGGFDQIRDNNILVGLCDCRPGNRLVAEIGIQFQRYTEGVPVIVIRLAINIDKLKIKHRPYGKSLRLHPVSLLIASYGCVDKIQDSIAALDFLVELIVHCLGCIFIYTLLVSVEIAHVRLPLIIRGNGHSLLVTGIIVWRKDSYFSRIPVRHRIGIVQHLGTVIIQVFKD